MLRPRPPKALEALTINPSRQGWPSFKTKADSIPKPKDGLLGVDLEYHKETLEPYMASIALSSGFIYAGSFKKVEYPLRQFYLVKGIKFVGHNILSADCDVLHKAWFDVPKMPTGGVIDTLLAYYAMNQHLCHGNKEQNDDLDSPEWRRGPGRLRLGSMASQYLFWAEYKTCRGAGCSGPCRDHQELWYNALDAYAPILCWNEMLKEAKTLKSKRWPDGVPLKRTHDHLVELQFALNAATEEGIPVDVDFVRNFELLLSKEKNEIFPFQVRDRIGKRGDVLKTKEVIYDVGFNPNSQKDVKDWLRNYGIHLETFSLEGLKEVLTKYKEDKTQRYPATEKCITKALERLIDFKKLGKGVKAWFDEKYIHLPGSFNYARLKPEWMAYGGSMGRQVSRRPNVQNIPVRGRLAEVRKAFKAPKGLKWLKSDAGQGEFRIFGYIGGVDPMDMGDDAFIWLVENTDRLFYEVAKETPVEYLKKPRNGAKQMVHACDYGEGLRLLPEEAMSKSNILRELDSGVLYLFTDWIFADKYIVGFDGSNLSKRMYGDSTWRNRRKALAAQIKYLHTFPAAQKAMQRIMDEVPQGHIITPSGHLLKLFGDNRDNIKKALAMNGQCSLSAYMQETFIEYSKRPYPPVMSIHDELGFLVPKEWDKKKCLDYVKDMSHKSKLIDGFQCPIDAHWGPSYGELEEIG